MPPAGFGRSAGVLVPLFSIPTSTSWGIGEIGDLVSFAGWLKTAGLSIIQVLPLNEMAARATSPYSAMSAMAIDPIYISVPLVEDFYGAGGEPSLGSAWQDVLDRARRAPAVSYENVRHVKDVALRAAYRWFCSTHLAAGSPRARQFESWCAREAWWLDDYAIYRAIHAREQERSWTEWPAPLGRRHPEALGQARAELEDEIRFRRYLQWIAAEQWQAARQAIRPVAVFGDLPFTVDGDSADVWVRADQFRFDVSVGAPPDAFSETGQRWGLPAPRWDAFEAHGFEWLDQRARRAVSLFDGYRIDHVVGFYRTYVIPDGERFGTLVPADPSEQQRLGEHIMRTFLRHGGCVIAEDLGTVPDAVRQSLTSLGVPGYRVLRWEREWHLEGRPFRDPRDYPALSVATTGTHDTETLAVWWDTLPAGDRRAVGRIPSLARWLGAALDLEQTPFSDAIRDAVLSMLYASGSDLLILPIQDIFGWRDRINVPALVDDTNWTWRLPVCADALVHDVEARRRAEALAGLARDFGRQGPCDPTRRSNDNSVTPGSST